MHDPAVSLYLDLLRRSLTRTLVPEYVPARRIGRSGLRRAIHARVVRELEARGQFVVEAEPHDPGLRGDWPTSAETMIGSVRLKHVQDRALEVLRADVPGDFIEAGVWRGGATILMRGVLAALGRTDRRVWVADSFEGLPPPNPELFPADAGDRHFEQEPLKVPRSEVEANFARYELLDEQVVFLEGWFKDTLPEAPIDKLALMRVDADMYESTITALESLYPKLSPGGYCIVDDYSNVNTPGCRAAVDDYRSAHGITETIVPVDWTAIEWRRER